MSDIKEHEIFAGINLPVDVESLKQFCEKRIQRSGDGLYSILQTVVENISKSKLSFISECAIHWSLDAKQ